ncbi:LytR/AlgR family response regulator transcription factor [Aquimarina hainanensis]|uniref:LytR/AlgR family response regulator transcription factor n=1 Tax=Aquimarina hainanensis TaxID=1578017 RepID=A0ABW5NA66_9FLAO
MQRPISEVFSKPNRSKLWIGLFFLIIGLSVLQDYLFSQIHGTGFYISDSLLYNSIWFFLVPFTFLEIWILTLFHCKNNIWLVLYRLAISSILSLLHILIFTSFFVSVSYFVFSPSHRFVRIFTNALSNEFSALILYYFIAPFVVFFLEKKLPKTTSNLIYSQNFKVKTGLKTIAISSQSIETISTDKPYTVITTSTNRYFDTRTMKVFETLLNPSTFLRVNRSTIINTHIVKELVSRKNGDYDALLSNGETVRLSRHYRANWQHLLQ